MSKTNTNPIIQFTKVTKKINLQSQKTFLFIDGSNLYAGQYELFGPHHYLNFQIFIKQIEKKLRVKFSKIFFYASYSPKPKRSSQKSKNYLKNEGLFYKNVKNTPNSIFFKGYRSKTSGKEKEVDVKLAVDIVNLAHQNRYNRLYIMSGDADFMHALFIVKKLQKQVNIVCIEGKIMHKATFYFNTSIFFFNKINYKAHKGQKIRYLKLPKTITNKT